MKCRKCGKAAAIELRRHNTAFCADDFLGFFQDQAREAIRKWKMFSKKDRVLVAVSGGKDSLALWDVLLMEGYTTAGLYIDLGIGEYSAESRQKAEAFAAERGAKLIVEEVRENLGAAIPEISFNTRRPTCSACGLSKRYIMNRAALDGGFSAVATGHNLDDETATLLGNVLHWKGDALARQAPVLPSTHEKLVRRVKPFFRISERETAAYALLRGIDYIMEECPFAKGASSLTYKDVLNRLEAESPGTKHNFLFTYLAKMRPAFAAADRVGLRECVRCGQATTSELCAFCKLTDEVAANRQRKGR